MVITFDLLTVNNFTSICPVECHINDRFLNVLMKKEDFILELNNIYNKIR